jgi:hypothetical protein
MSGSDKSLATTPGPDARRGLAHEDRSLAAATEHPAVRFYEDDGSLARIVAEFLAEGFDRGNPGIIIATSNQRVAIVQELSNRSFEVGALQRSNDLLMADAEEILSTVIVDGQPDAVTFQDQIHRLVETVRRGRTNCTVHVFGQMVDVLWQKGQREAAIRLEVLWNQLAQSDAASLVCGYAIGNFYKDASFEDLCGSRSHFVSAEGTAKRAVSTTCDTSRRQPKRRRP